MSMKRIKGLLFVVCSLVLAGFSFQPAMAQSCVDPDGDGWGWDGSATCTVVTQQQSDEACIDTDGDGWGWDGTASCQVASSQNSGTESTASNSSATECIDTDGDGWGWGANGTCRVEGSGSGTVVTNPTTTAPNTNNTVNISGSYNRSRDLIALHFDHAPDLDDGHAAAAAFVVQDQLGLAVQVVGGTYGVYSADRYVPASESLMNSIWGSAWLNAHSNRASAVDQAAIRWVGTLAAGGDVWIAEGGPSDFSAAVVRQIQQQYPEFQTRQRIHLIQHSKWNEDHALRADLNFVRANTNYVVIEDGNEPNSTADLREFRQSFVDRARASAYSGAWNAAFAYLSPYEKLDFSDTVELLYILGIGTSQIANADDFANSFF